MFCSVLGGNRSTADLDMLQTGNGTRTWMTNNRGTDWIIEGIFRLLIENILGKIITMSLINTAHGSQSQGEDAPVGQAVISNSRGMTLIGKKNRGMRAI
jgi:hypothetical protein